MNPELHNLIASDAYWDIPELPQVSPPTFVNGINSIFSPFFIRAIDQVWRQTRQNDAEVTPIPKGEPIPIPGYDQVIKLVTDRRIRPKDPNALEPAEEYFAEFNRVANKMVDDLWYRSSKTIAHVETERGVVEVGRVVMYLAMPLLGRRHLSKPSNKLGEGVNFVGTMKPCPVGHGVCHETAGAFYEGQTISAELISAIPRGRGEAGRSRRFVAPQITGPRPSAIALGGA